MREINSNFAKRNNLKLIRRVSTNDFSKMILVMERLKEDKKISSFCN